MTTKVMDINKKENMAGKESDNYSTKNNSKCPNQEKYNKPLNE